MFRRIGKKKTPLPPPLTPAARLRLLSPKRQEIIRPALERPRAFVLLSVRAMAHLLKTDPATMVRIVRGMQFESYREFQHYLHELSIAHATSLDTMQTGADRKFTLSRQTRASLDQDLKNLNRLIRTFDGERIANLTRRLYSARRIVVIGGDLASHLVRFLEHHLMILDLPISCATTAAEVVHKVRFVGKKDLVIAISFRRGLRQTVEGVHLAHDRNAYCVGVTDTYVSPLARECDEVFLASVESTSFGASYAAPVALVNAILAACGQYRRPQTLAILKEIAEEQRKGFRWYTV